MLNRRRRKFSKHPRATEMASRNTRSKHVPASHFGMRTATPTRGDSNMNCRLSSAMGMTTIFLAQLLFGLFAAAQNASEPSLAQQVKKQYKVTKLGADSNVLEEGTLLVIQAEGILGVPSASVDLCPATYKDGALHTPSADEKTHCGKNIRKLSTGEKVYVLKIEVDSKRDQVSLLVVECGSCNGSTQLASYKSLIVFQFPEGYLAAADAGQVEDVIAQVITIDSSNKTTPQQASGGQSSPGVLTNEEVIKLVQAKLPDSVVLAKIKSSSCDFDTSTDALVKLKRAGVSDSVLEAIVDAQVQSVHSDPAENPPPAAPAESPVSAPPPAQMTFPVRHRHISLVGPGSDAIYYCSGDLSVSADSTVRYDCTQTDDPSGRCDHVSVPAGYLKQAKMGSDGALHLASKGQGNFDFFGDPSTVKGALTAIQPLTVIVAKPSTDITAAPPKPAASNCGDYESCMKKGEASLEQSEGGAEALTEFEKASELAPSKGEPLAGKGHAYLQMGQYDNAVYMWDSALKLGATLSSPVCHAGMACGDTGDFLFSMKEVSFINKKGEKKFAAAPSAVTSEVGTPPVVLGNGQIVAYYVQLRFAEKNYRFYYSPKSLQCRSNFLCSEPGLSQQKIFADYIHGALVRMAAGDLGPQPNKP